VLEAQRWFYLQTGIFVGNSSAANIAVARNIRESKRFDGVPVVTVAYDSGLWYNDFIAITV
jgi:cysteine synthase